MMNSSGENRAVSTMCNVAETSYVILRQFPDEKYERYRIAVLVVNCILFLTTISLNAISIITIRRSSQLKSKVCYFVILLQSAVDLGVGVLGLPLYIFSLMTPFLDTLNCSFVILIRRTAYLTCALSIVTVSAMTLERYIGVLHPYSYETNVTKKRILCYVCVFGFVVFFVLGYSFRDATVSRRLIQALVAVFFLFTAFAYVRIYLVIRKLIRSERRPTCQNGGNRNVLKRQIIRESRHATSCFLVVICFAFFLLPSTLSSAAFSYGSADYIVYRSWTITSMILNSSINSLIFFWTKTLLRKEALKTLKALCS